ncbi:hypothetical protein WOLCODRAFT_133046 [Wolfiporia cocos MD-104 SS10]|uniref:AB hydrolase-1 domain-containing protein n=1 Tax=Wolfiporia cocos (strain MD-104) TaxID=742152 RepID=A0A2H3JYH3_WOLCO|nr:hypothetical protein WOLCODRAFT_133046 [Wolfiporia cocos MD-104 SS10]
MPIAPVDSQGTYLYFEDSGAPPTAAPYTTLVLVHGTIIHGAIFHPMYQYAAQNSIRLVTVNLRDYPGSSPTSTEVLNAIRENRREILATIIRDRGLEIIAFLEWLIKTENLPPRSQSSNDETEASGGISVLGWSSGNFMTISLLAHGSTLSQDRQKHLGAYLRSIILYDPPYHALGLPPPSLEELYGPLRDQSIPPEEIGKRFSLWCSGYYRHSPDILSSLASCTRAELFAGLAHYPEEDMPATLIRMSPAEVAEVTDWERAPQAHVPLTNADPSVYAQNAHHALKEVNVWPDVYVTLVWCDMSVGDTIIAAWELSRKVEAAWPLEGRRVSIVRMNGANHFPHWDNPQETLHLLSTIA